MTPTARGGHEKKSAGSRDGSRRDGRSRQQILRAAREEFARSGYAGTSMRRIAEAAGLTKAALYYHYPDKASLFRSAAEEGMRARPGRIGAQARHRTDCRSRLRALVHAYLAQYGGDRALSRRLCTLLFLPSGAEGWTGRIASEMVRPLGEAITACAEEGLVSPRRVEEVTILLMGGIEYVGVRWLLDPQATAPSNDMGDRLLAQVMPAAFPVVEETTTVRPPARRGRALRTAIAALLLPLVGLAGAQQAAPLEQAPEVVVAIAGEGTPAALDLTTCLVAALESNAALRAERERLGELQGQMVQALATGLPTLDATGTWSRGRDPSFAFNENFGGGGGADSTSAPTGLDSLLAGFSFIPDAEDIKAQTSWRAALDARWELNPMLVINAVRAAGLGVERQGLMVESAAHGTEEEVMTSYYGVIRAGENLDALDATLEARREFLDVTRRRFFLGLSTPLDTLRAAVELANLMPQRRSAAQALRDAGNALNVAMGRPPLEPIAVAGRVPVERGDLEAEVVADRVGRRPDLRALDLWQGIMRKNLGAQKAQMRPSISANGSYGYVSSDFADLTDDGHDFWSAGVTLTVPLFNGLLTRGQVQETRATLRRLGQEYEQARRMARLEVLSLHGALEAARFNLEAARLNLGAAQDALDQVNLRYELGKAEYLAVLDVQAAWFQARSNCIQARNEVLTLTASLKRALGFSPSRPLDEVAAILEREARDAALEQ